MYVQVCTYVQMCTCVNIEQFIAAKMTYELTFELHFLPKYIYVHTYVWIDYVSNYLEIRISVTYGTSRKKVNFRRA